ncbi:MAG: hypothetical protein JW771_03160 [Candidatus Thermoplasmatota archaeon]|nr:hypothetical protein [Candidatus Thermoplasmatota archaeon]
MNALEDDPILGQFFDSAEKKARWMVRLKFLYLVWIVFIVVGISFLIWYSLP